MVELSLETKVSELHSDCLKLRQRNEAISFSGFVFIKAGGITLLFFFGRQGELDPRSHDPPQDLFFHLLIFAQICQRVRHLERHLATTAQPTLRNKDLSDAAVGPWSLQSVEDLPVFVQKENQRKVA